MVEIKEEDTKNDRNVCAPAWYNSQSQTNLLVFQVVGLLFDSRFLIHWWYKIHAMEQWLSKGSLSSLCTMEYV